MVSRFPPGDGAAPERSLIASIACHAPTTPAAAPTMPASAHPGESFRKGIRGITHRRQGPAPGTTVSIWPPNRRTPAWTSGRRVTTAASLHRYFVERLLAAVHDRVVLPEQRGGVRRGERLRVHVDRQVRPEHPQRRGRGVGLPFPHGVGPVDHLAVEVGVSTRSSSITPIRPIPAAASRGGRATQPPAPTTSADAREEPLLPGLPQFLDEDVPAVPQRVFSDQFVEILYRIQAGLGKARLRGETFADRRRTDPGRGVSGHRELPVLQPRGRIAVPARAAKAGIDMLERARDEGRTASGNGGAGRRDARPVRADHGASPDEIAFVKNTSKGLSFVAAGPRGRKGTTWSPRTSSTPPTCILARLRTRNVEVHMVPAREGRVRKEDLFAACDGKTRLITLSSVEFRTATGTICRGSGSIARITGSLLRRRNPVRGRPPEST